MDVEKTEGIYYSMLFFFFITNMLINTDSGRTIQKKINKVFVHFQLFCTFLFFGVCLVVDLNALNMVVVVV